MTAWSKSSTTSPSCAGGGTAGCFNSVGKRSGEQSRRWRNEIMMRVAAQRGAEETYVDVVVGWWWERRAKFAEVLWPWVCIAIIL